MNQNFEHLNGPIKSVHDNELACGVAGLCFVKEPEGWHFGANMHIATIYSTDAWPEFAYIERRMVAAWNACQSLPLEALEMTESAGLFFAHVGQVINERDEATTALNSIIQYFRSGNSVAVQQVTIRSDSPEIVRALEVLAKLKGGAA